MFNFSTGWSATPDNSTETSCASVLLTGLPPSAGPAADAEVESAVRRAVEGAGCGPVVEYNRPAGYDFAFVRLASVASAGRALGAFRRGGLEVPGEGGKASSAAVRDGRRAHASVAEWRRGLRERAAGRDGA
mmetsp:Transcript_21907/g.74460  ORF Transcript_21907/g.74460 Transcript_21907/m.74460 type:complete len:132 (+) Transcript_21907:603-998(+)